MIGDLKENVIEWYTGDDTCTATFTQKKFINRIRRLSETHGKRVKIVAENADGSITCKFPLRAVHLTIYCPKTGSFEGVDEEDEE
jgi:hypothetical protein